VLGPRDIEKRKNVEGFLNTKTQNKHLETISKTALGLGISMSNKKGRLLYVVIRI
jgi:hypothetical protein